MKAHTSTFSSEITSLFSICVPDRRVSEQSYSRVFIFLHPLLTGKSPLWKTKQQLLGLGSGPGSIHFAIATRSPIARAPITSPCSLIICHSPQTARCSSALESMETGPSTTSPSTSSTIIPDHYVKRLWRRQTLLIGNGGTGRTVSNESARNWVVADAGRKDPVY